MKQIIKIAVATGSCALVALAASQPAQAFSGKRHHAHKGHHHGQVVYRENDLRTKYAPRYRKGHRRDCGQIGFRARATGSAYWRYAAHSCVHDLYNKSY